MRILFSVFLTFLLVGFLISPASSSSLKVGFIATNFAAESQARVANAFEKLTKDKGWDSIILNSAGSDEKQMNQLENLVQMKVDAIVLAMAHPLVIQPALQKAFDAKIPVITIDSGYVEGIVADITTDNFVMGAKIATYFVDALGGKGNIIVVKYEKHFGTRRRGKILDVVLSEYPGIKVLAEYTITSPAKFMEETRSALETYAQQYGKQINGVWCCFDQLAYIASDVLQSYGVNAIIVGIDGNKETFRRIKEGKMTATVAQPFEEMAKKAVELIEKIVVRKISPEKATGGRKVIYLDAPLVDKTNVSSFLTK